MFSKACEYGIRATIHISHRSQLGERVSLNAIATAIDSPVAFTAKILQSLANDEIIISAKGPNGGYEIPEKKQKRVTLLQIVTAIDGDKIFDGCGLGLKSCNDKTPCPLHSRFKEIRSNLKIMLKNTTVYELAIGIQTGGGILKL